MTDETLPKRIIVIGGPINKLRDNIRRLGFNPGATEIIYINGTEPLVPTDNAGLIHVKWFAHGLILAQSYRDALKQWGAESTMEEALVWLNRRL